MRSTNHINMYLRNGRIKTEPIDLDADYYVMPVKKSGNKRRLSLNRLQKILIESDDSDDNVGSCKDDNDNDDDYKPELDELYEPVPAVDRVLRVRRPKVPIQQPDEFDDDGALIRANLMSQRGSMPNLMKAVDNVENVANYKPSRLNQSAPARVIAAPSSIDYEEKRLYSCHLCGKDFQHLCRLRIHMPSHTHERRYECPLCCKRYKSSSSLNAHKKITHFGKPPKARPRSTKAKKATKKSMQKSPITKQSVIKMLTPKTEFTNECGKLVEIKMESNDDENAMEMETSTELDLDPLGIREHEPFVHVWNDCDSVRPMTLDSIKKESPNMEVDQIDHQKMETEETCATAIKINPSHDQMNHNDCSNLKMNDEEYPSTYITSSELKPPKFEIWQKESVNDPRLAYYVDILRIPKSKRTLFPTTPEPSPMETMWTRSSSSSSRTGGNMKNTAMAKGFRGFGDIEFTLGKWDSARQWYNRSLCHAERKTYHFAIAYAKRAQCFFKEHMYRTCWTDLMLAQNSGLPEILLPELERHKQTCKSKVIQQRMQMNQPSSAGAATPMTPVQPKLSFPNNPSFPEMADVLQIDRNEFYGRHIRARQPIDVGQILIIETGFVATTTAHYEKCCVCLTSDTNLVPCSCCTRALLCRNCVKGWSHQIECQLQMALDLHEYPWISKVLRSFLNAINLFENANEMMDFVNETISNQCGMQFVAPIIDQKSKYRAFLQLITVPTIQPEMIPIVSQLHAVLLRHPAIGTRFTTKKSQRFLAHLLVHHICVIMAFSTKVGSVVCENGLTEIVAPITSYLKHSCAPNVSKFVLGNTVIVVAMRPIEQGEQLYVSYCDVSKSTNDRQHILQMEYGFQCRCERCLSACDLLIDGQSNAAVAVDQQIQAFQFDEAEKFITQNFTFLASTEQRKRKQLSDYVVAILQQYGRMPWTDIGPNIGWAYVVFSLLLSQRFQKKLLY